MIIVISLRLNKFISKRIKFIKKNNRDYSKKFILNKLKKFIK